jgi:hypothetical protein
MGFVHRRVLRCVEKRPQRRRQVSHQRRALALGGGGPVGAQQVQPRLGVCQLRRKEKRRPNACEMWGSFYAPSTHAGERSM